MWGPFCALRRTLRYIFPLSITVILKYKLTGTFFCVTTTALSFPLTATEVRPPWFIALKAYSEKKSKKKKFYNNCRPKQYHSLLFWEITLFPHFCKLYLKKSTFFHENILIVFLFLLTKDLLMSTMFS